MGDFSKIIGWNLQTKSKNKKNDMFLNESRFPNYAFNEMLKQSSPNLWKEIRKNNHVCLMVPSSTKKEIRL